MKTKSLGWTTEKQAQQLIKAGLPSETADMYIPQEDTTPKVIQLSLEEHHAYYPCWSLGRLISLMPDFIFNTLGQYDMFLHVQNNYVDYDHFDDETDIYVEDFKASANGLVQNVVETIIWLLKQEYIEKVE